MEISSAHLDTGQAFDVLAPLDEVAGLLDPDDVQVRHMGTLGGTVRCQVAPANLKILGQIVPVEVWGLPCTSTWLIGLPVLARFNLLFVRDDMELRWLVAP